VNFGELRQCEVPRIFLPRTPVNNARTREALFEATHQALSALTIEDARGFFSHCGYGKTQALPI
jgi:hypothetical protein